MDGGRRWRKGERDEKGNRGSCEWEDGAGGVGWGNGERGEAAGAGRGLLLGLWGCGHLGAVPRRTPSGVSEQDKQVKSRRREGRQVTGTTARHTQE